MATYVSVRSAPRQHGINRTTASQSVDSRWNTRALNSSSRSYSRDLPHALQVTLTPPTLRR